MENTGIDVTEWETKYSTHECYRQDVAEFLNKMKTDNYVFGIDSVLESNNYKVFIIYHVMNERPSLKIEH